MREVSWDLTSKCDKCEMLEIGTKTKVVPTETSVIIKVILSCKNRGKRGCKRKIHKG